MSRGFYRRHLPHFDAIGRIVFVTFNLKGALPAEARARLRAEREEMEGLLTRIAPSSGANEKSNLLLDHARKLFRISEEFLDAAEHGPRDLADPEVARIVRDRIVEGAGRFYELLAYVVMPNHVHLLIRPRVELERILGGIKKASALEIHRRRRGSEGGAFWQDESFDHFPRDADAVERFVRYIEGNPVAAGLCEKAEDWPWSSATSPREDKPETLPR